MKKLPGSKQAEALQKAMLDLIGEFDEERTKSGMSARMIDAHVSSILINLLCLVVAERETYSARDLAKITARELKEASP